MIKKTVLIYLGYLTTATKLHIRLLAYENTGIFGSFIYCVKEVDRYALFKSVFFRQPCITGITTTVTRSSGSVVRFYAATALREWIWMKYG